MPDPGLRTPLLDFFRRGEVARDIRLQAAQGGMAPRAHEQIALLMLLIDDADPDTMLGLRSAIEISDVKLILVGQCQEEILMEAIERGRVHRLVAVVPPDHILGQLVLDGEFVLRTPSGVLSGANDERAVLRQQPLTATHGMLHKRCGGEIPENLCARCDTLRFKAVTRDPVGHFDRTPSQNNKKRRRPVEGLAAAKQCA